MAESFDAPFVKIFVSIPFVREVVDNGTRKKVKVQEFLEFQTVESFLYMDSIKIDDATTLVLRADSIDIVDDVNLMPGRVIKFIFGYLSRGGGEITSDVVTQYIFDRKLEFAADGIRLTLNCYAKAAYMKLNSSDKVRENVTALDTAAEFANLYELDLSSDLLDGQRNFTEAEVDSKLLKELSPDQLRQAELTKFVVPKMGTRFVEKGRGTSETETFDTGETEATYHLKVFKSRPQANQNDAKELQDQLALQEGGSWLASGKDDKLIITRRNFSKEPLKSFTFEKSENRIISFIPKENNKSNIKSGVSVLLNQWNDEAKQFQRGVSNALDSSDKILADQRILDWINQEVGDEALFGIDPNDYRNLADKIMAVPLTYLDVPVVKEDATKALNTAHGLGPIISAGKEASKFTAPPPAPTGFKYIARPGMVLHTVENDPEDAQILGDNLRREEELELHSAKMEVIGDPHILSNNIVTVFGVGNRYSGNWFVDAVAHRLSGDGPYITILDLVRNALGKDADQENQSLVDGLTMGLDINSVFKTIDEDDKITRTVTEKE